MIFKQLTAKAKCTTGEKRDSMFYTLNAIIPNHPTASRHFVREWFKTLRLVEPASSSTALAPAVENKGRA
jgi:hypothetical protein